MPSGRKPELKAARPVSLNMDKDSFGVLSRYAQRRKIPLSEAGRYLVLAGEGKHIADVMDCLKNENEAMHEHVASLERELSKLKGSLGRQKRAAEGSEAAKVATRAAWVRNPNSKGFIQRQVPLSAKSESP